MKIAAIGDLHMHHGAIGAFRHIFEDISKHAEILLICGDLTENGLINEAQLLTDELSYCKIPIIAVLGNHDYTNNQQEEIKKILSPKFLFILGDQPFTFKNIGFAGVKGFCGGFDNHLVSPFGEPIFKQFIYESVNETIKLEQALTRLDTKDKIVLLHYSPIRKTLEGEPLEIYPLLGTSRLVEPIDNFNVTAVFHGHAHHGYPIGKTQKGIPVYNVSLSLLMHINPKKPYFILNI